MALGSTTAGDDIPRLQGVVKELLLGTDGSAMERERITAVVRDRVMATPLPTAPHVGAWTVIANTGTVPRATNDSAPQLAAAHLPRYFDTRDLQSLEKFLERLENFCLVTGVAANKRLTHVVPAALEGGAKSWWRFVRGFVRGFDSWEQFTAAFCSEFSSSDAKRRLRAELEQRTQHREENLKEFIYAMATFYDRIGEEVSEAQKVQRVLRQMHPQLQDLAEGHAYNNLAKLVKAADGLMEQAWRRLQYRPLPLPSNQVARDLAFRPSLAPDHRSLPQPNTMATASFASFVAAPSAPPTYHWPLHPAALDPSYCRDRQYSCDTAPLFSPYGPGPMPRQEPTSGAMRLQCHCCGGFGHIYRNCAMGRRMGIRIRSVTCACRFLLAIECGKLFSIDLIGAIHLLEYSWGQVKATTVQNCFKRAGFSVCAADTDDASDTIDQTLDIIDEACKTLLAEVLEWQGVTEGVSFPDFRDADSDVQASPDMSDEAIVASVVEVSPNDSDEDDMESNNTADSGPTVAEAAHCVSVMRVFAEKRGLAEKLANSKSEFEDAVVTAGPPHRQMKITDFVTQS
ncbi:hypothetical protein HPB51_025916 [Rhipicephalus microplus]|uniref:Retrotransposon gag domain-containing protein n=1 Tax=Rhipicephalus microplus TaxID=6941 RepID=A0A9J6EDU0_RHIMP|nr:hypothetical protein HPB51_025916 [Rhipicephalus microplus]